MGREFPIARAMPSPMCTGGRGLTALVFPARTAKGERAAVWRVFEGLGAVVEIAEEHMDSFTVCYSVSHGYHALDALAAAGERCGLPAELALTVAAHALADGVLAWRQMGRQSLPKLLAKASTPGGTAEATASAMDRAGYRRSILAGLRAGIERARALRGGGPAARRRER
jgi:pyrroline-5-carboxylate reductase